MPAYADIAADANRHSALLAELQSLESAEVGHRDASASLADLQAQEAQLVKRLASLKAATSKVRLYVTAIGQPPVTPVQEYREFKEIQQSTSTRFFTRARHGGSKDALASRVSKEEREYNEAYEAETDCAEALGVVSSQVTATKAQVEDLASLRTRYEAVEKELAAMYERLFDGPTEGFPEEGAWRVFMTSAAERPRR